MEQPKKGKPRGRPRGKPPKQPREPVPRSSTQIRTLWLNVPDHIIPRAKSPRRLTQEDMEANYEFRGEDGDEHVRDLILRVSAGVKPFATILLRCPRRTLVPEKTLVDTLHRLNLHQSIFFTSKGRRTAVVYQGVATLGQYFDADQTIARYAREGVKLDRELFETPLIRLARHVAFEEFPEDIKLALLGLCFGYPINETIDLLQTHKLVAASATART